MKFLYFLCLFCLTQVSFSQEIESRLLATYPFELERFIGVDNFDNFYGINKDVFYKIEEGKTQEFQALQLGEISSADIINPLKITLFYKNTNTVVILDNNLNEIKRINFSQLPKFKNLGFATTAKDRSLWIYNLDLQRIELFDYNRNKTSSHTQPLDKEILRQKSNFNFCWVLGEKQLKKYNSYGSLVTKIENQKFINITEDNENLLVLKNDFSLALLVKNQKKFIPLSISKIGIKDFYLQNEFLYIYSKEKIYQYQLTLPK